MLPRLISGVATCASKGSTSPARVPRGSKRNRSLIFHRSINTLSRRATPSHIAQEVVEKPMRISRRDLMGGVCGVVAAPFVAGPAFGQKTFQLSSLNTGSTKTSAYLETPSGHF